jgi:hypothetical protein
MALWLHTAWLLTGSFLMGARALFCPGWTGSSVELLVRTQTFPPNLFKLNLVFATLAADTASRITAGLKFLPIRK